MNPLKLLNAKHLRNVAVIGEIDPVDILPATDNGTQLPTLHVFAPECHLREWETRIVALGRKIRPYPSENRDDEFSAYCSQLSDLFVKHSKPQFDLVVLTYSTLKSADVPFLLLADQLVEKGGYMAFVCAENADSPPVTSSPLIPLLQSPLNYLEVSAGSLFRKRMQLLTRERTKAALVTSPVVAREVELCPFRSQVHVVETLEWATCQRLIELTQIVDRSMAEVPRHSCDSCRTRETDSLELNPIIASELYKLTRRIIESGGTEGCAPEKAESLMALAEDHLEWQFGPSLSQDISSFRRNPADCVHLVPLDSAVEVAVASDVASPKVFGCKHPGHETTTLPECHYCRDFEEEHSKPRVPLTQLLPTPGRSSSQKISSWAVAVTTAPRKKPTLDACVDSILRAGWSRPTLFVDEGTAIAPRHAHLPVTYREQRVGAWPNFYLALSELIMREPYADAYFLVQDDAVLYDRENLRGWLESVLWPGPNIAAVSLFCSSAYTKPDPGWHVHDNLWVWGALAFIFPNQSARQFLIDASVVEHRRSSRHGTANIDVVIGQWAKRRGMEIYYPTPSLVQHIGETSTLWPQGTLQGKRSADYFAGDLPPKRLPPPRDDPERIILSHADVDFPIHYNRVKNTLFQTDPVVFHFPTIYRRLNAENALFWIDLLRIARQKLALTQPKDVTLVTWNNEITRSIAEIYAAHSGLNIHVLGRGVSHWSNLLKIRLTSDFLKSVKTKYLLTIDGSDAVILGDLRKVVDLMESTDFDAIFSSETVCFPNSEELREKQEDLAPKETPFKFLNSGIAMFRMEAAEKLFEQALNTEPIGDRNSDQSVWQQLFCTQPGMGLDYECQVFQTVNRYDQAADFLELYDGSSA